MLPKTHKPEGAGTLMKKAKLDEVHRYNAKGRAKCNSCDWMGSSNQANKHARENPGHSVSVLRSYTVKVKGSKLVKPPIPVLEF